MDRAPAVGLGLAIAQPNRKVLVLDCDAPLRTDLGSLATVGQSETENLVHFVFDDANKTSTDGVAIHGAENVNLLAMAEGAGYAKSYEFEALEELLIGLEEVMRQPGPVFVMVKIFRDGDPLPFPERPMAEGWGAVRQTLVMQNQREG